MLQTHSRAEPNPSAGLLLQFLAWVAARPRTYGEAMDAWRTSCPRLSVWEDALEGGLIRVEVADATVQDVARVLLTSTGAEHLVTAART